MTSKITNLCHLSGTILHSIAKHLHHHRLPYYYYLWKQRKNSAHTKQNKTPCRTSFSQVREKPKKKTHTHTHTKRRRRGKQQRQQKKKKKHSNTIHDKLASERASEHDESLERNTDPEQSRMSKLLIKKVS
jgi:hypothetical protein